MARRRRLYRGGVEQVTIVHTRRGMFLTKKHYDSWRDAQDEFADYMTSLGPYSVEELIDYLDIEYPSSKPFERIEIEEFIADPSRSVLWSE
jgi:hypothetical protein